MLGWCHRIAIFRQTDRRFKNLGPGQLAPFPVRLFHQPHIAGHADRKAAGNRLTETHGLAFFIKKARRTRCCRGHLAAINRLHPVSLGIMVQEKSAAANPAGLRFYNGQRQHHRHRGIGGRTTSAQHFKTGFGGFRMG